MKELHSFYKVKVDLMKMNEYGQKKKILLIANSFKPIWKRKSVMAAVAFSFSFCQLTDTLLLIPPHKNEHSLTHGT